MILNVEKYYRTWYESRLSLCKNMNLFQYILSLCKNSRGLFIERIKQPSIIICKKKSQVHTAFPILNLRIRLSSFEWIRHHACHNHNLHYARGVCATNIKYTRWYVEIDIHILMKNRYIRKTWAEIISKPWILF